MSATINDLTPGERRKLTDAEYNLVKRLLDTYHYDDPVDAVQDARDIARKKGS